MNRSHNLRRPLVATVTVAILLVAGPTFAEGEASFFVGGLLGGDVVSVTEGDVISSFQDGAIYGGRLGWSGYPFGVEGSFGYSPSGLSADLADQLLEVDTRVMYLEANAVVILLPFAVSPFVTGGAGLQSFNFHGDIEPIGTEVNLATVNKFGFNFGAGLKGNIGRITIRADVRDHVTKFEETDFGIAGGIAEILGFEFEETVHNVEVSFGVGVRF